MQINFTKPAAPSAAPSNLPAVNATPPVQNSNPVAAALPAPKSHKGVIFAVVSILLVLILSGLGFAYVKGWISIPNFGAPKLTLSEIADKLLAVKSGHADIAIDLRIEPRDQEVATFQVPGVDSMDAESLGLLAGRMQLALNISEDWKSKNDLADSSSAITGTFSSGGISLSLDVGLKLIDDQLFLQVNTLPLPEIGNITAIAGKWIAFPGTLTNFDSEAFYDNPETRVFKQTFSSGSVPNEDSTKLLKQEFAALWAECLKQNALKIENITKVKAGNDSVWLVNISFNAAAFQRAYLAAFESYPMDGVKEKFIMGTDVYSAVKDPGFLEQLQATTKDLRFQVELSEQGLEPTKIALEYLLAPSFDGAEATNQLHLKLSEAFSKANQPVSIVKPAATITPTEASRLMSGMSEAEARYEEQLRIVRDLRTALEMYSNAHQNSYPEKLSDLIGTSDSALTVVNIPKDLYTLLPFVYRKVQTGSKLSYELDYQTKIPAGLDAWQISTVEGLNTATIFSESKQYSEAHDANNVPLPLD
ncbi:MAG: hypothetical protein V1821_04260 [bacterium]